MKDIKLKEKESLDKINDIEIRLSDYITNTSYALIAANWALITYAGSKDNSTSEVIKYIDVDYLATSILFSISFLVYKGFLSILNLYHHHYIFDNCKNLEFGYDKSKYGKVHRKIDNFKYLFLFLSILFVLIPIMKETYYVLVNFINQIF